MEALPNTAQREIRNVTREFDTGGQEAGGALARGMEQGFVRNSPVILAAVSGVLTAGVPTVSAAAGSLFIAIAAAAEHSNAQMQSTFNQMKSDITSTFTDAAQVTVPMFVNAMDRVDSAVQALGPQLHTAFAALGGPIESLTTGVLALANNAMPGLVRMISTSGPIFQGLSTLLSDVGTGLSQMFSIISDHSGAGGTVFASLGSAIGALLPILGQLVGAGAELASSVLPPIASALHGVSTALGFLSPVLPGVLAGFLAFKGVALLSPMLVTLAASLETTGASAMTTVAELTGVEAAGVAAGTGFEVAAAGVRGFEAALGPIGWVIAGLSVAVPLLTHFLGDQGDTTAKTSAAVQSYASALGEAKGAINATTTAAAAKAAQDAGLLDVAQQLHIPLSQVTDAITLQGSALGDMRGQLQQTILEHTKFSASGAYATATMDGQAKAAQKALDALNKLSGQTKTSQSDQQQLAVAMQGTSVAEQDNATRLQGLADKAGAANTQIGLLKGALDALTGKTVTMDQAEIAVTQSVDAAAQAIKGKTAALSFSNGQLDLSNSKSATAAQLLIQLAGNQKQVIATAEQQGQTMGQVNKIADDQRAQFIKVAESLGATSAQAQALANRYLGIPKSVHTEVTADTRQATAAAAAFAAYWNSISSRKVVMTTEYVSYGGLGRLGSTTAEAHGGIVHAFAAGGFEAMSAGVAQIVPPQTYRLIGDRIADDEAYIPINHSARSRAILQQTNSRMGDPLGAGAEGVSAQAATSGGGIRDLVHFDGDYVAAPNDDPNETARKLAVLARTGGAG